MGAAVEFRLTFTGDHHHVCRVPRPRDLELAEVHVCACGKRWIYQPAHWENVLTLQELRRRQEAGPFLRGLVPTFQPDNEPETSDVVPIPKSRSAKPER
jgi:hypothetical protein